jgi:DNA polymerase III subunit delta'
LLSALRRFAEAGDLYLLWQVSRFQQTPKRLDFMQWSDLLGHEKQRDWLRTAIASGRLATSFLFVGPEGIGKRSFARLVAKSLLCERADDNHFDCCNACEGCAQVDASTHPDLIEISKPPDKAFIPIELLIGERDKRMREGLCHDISLKPYAGRRKIAILDDADHLNVEGANSLLKTLEEPPPDSVLILVGSNLQRQLPTIRSRCQAIIFKPLMLEQLQTLIERHGIADSPQRAEDIARLCNGSLAEAKLLADIELAEFRATLFSMLASDRLNFAELTKSCGGMIDAAGKDGRAKRERAKLLLRACAAFYRTIVLRLSGAHDTPDSSLAHAIEQTLPKWRTGTHGAVRCWQRCLLAMEQVDRNANQGSWLEDWSTSLATMSGR